MEAFFSILCLAGMVYAGFKGMKWMSRTGLAQAHKEQPLSPSDLKALEESASRLMAELRQVADDCVARIERASSEADRRTQMACHTPIASTNDHSPSATASAGDTPSNPVELAPEGRMTTGEMELVAGLRALAGS